MQPIIIIFINILNIIHQTLLILTIQNVSPLEQMQMIVSIYSVQQIFIILLLNFNHFIIIISQKQYKMLREVNFKNSFRVSNIDLSLTNIIEHQVQLPKPSEGIIFIKLKFHKLYTHPIKQIPPIKRILIEMKDQYASLEVDIFTKRLDKNQDSLLKISSTKNGIRTIKKIDEMLIPFDKQSAKEILQRKIWIQINKKSNKFIVGRGDLQNHKQIQLFSTSLGKTLERTWKNDVDVFPNNNYQEPEQNFFNINSANFRFEFWEDLLPNPILKTKQQLKKYYTEMLSWIQINILQLGRKQGPVLEKNPSIINRSIGNLLNMSPQIQLLYSMLQKLTLYQLPKFETNQKNKHEYYDYINWKNSKFAIHSSLVTKYNYFGGYPVGILNHMYKIKNKRQYQPFQFYKNQGNNMVPKTKEEIKEQIYKKRSGYLRFQVIPPEGTSPGSPAVFEIWPPYNCSSIHNHGQADGLIKVLAGEIHVQNFKDLSFAQEKPYLQNNYKENGYTWLTSYSYGIHRLVNIYPQTCITLQSYANTKNSNEYFSVISKVDNQPVLKRYYPQHDWKNYLKQIYNKDCPAADKKFIQSVISYYGLKKKVEEGDEIDSSFMRFMLVMKKEYEVIANTVWNN